MYWLAVITAKIYKKHTYWLGVVTEKIYKIHILAECDHS